MRIKRKIHLKVKKSCLLERIVVHVYAVKEQEPQRSDVVW